MISHTNRQGIKLGIFVVVVEQWAGVCTFLSDLFAYGHNAKVDELKKGIA